jgi:uncharacterized protein YdhG (YjbR/CyaY superfamily)
MAAKRAGSRPRSPGTSKPTGTEVPGTVDAYLAALSPEERSALQSLRTVIREAAPDATESIAYRIPSYEYKGYLVGIGAKKNHLAFYVTSPPLLEAHASELAEFDVGKGCIRFPASRPLSKALVRELVRARVVENESRAAR